MKKKVFLFLLPIAGVVAGIILAGSGSKRDSSQIKDLASNLTFISIDPPKSLNFSGELVPTRDFEVRERLDKELIRMTYYHSATIMNIKRANRWRGAISAILRDNKIPEDFFYLAVAESFLTNATSPAGAKGFWQFMKATGTSYGLEISKEVDERYDPIKSTHAACKYLKDAYRMFKNWTLVAASYNMGMGGVQSQIRKQKVDNYYDLFLNRETSAYIFRILALKSILGNPEQYGFKLKKSQLYPPLRYKTVKVDTTIPDLVTFAQSLGTTYKMIKVLNPWILKDHLTVGSDKSYTIKVPRDADLPDAAALLPQTDSLGVDSSEVDVESPDSSDTVSEQSDQDSVVGEKPDTAGSSSIFAPKPDSVPEKEK